VSSVAGPRTLCQSVAWPRLAPNHMSGSGYFLLVQLDDAILLPTCSTCMYDAHCEKRNECKRILLMAKKRLFLFIVDFPTTLTCNFN
jgi:hypothetical protein